jgi:hypothetical protein
MPLLEVEWIPFVPSNVRCPPYAEMLIDDPQSFDPQFLRPALGLHLLWTWPPWWRAMTPNELHMSWSDAYIYLSGNCFGCALVLGKHKLRHFLMRVWRNCRWPDNHSHWPWYADSHLLRVWSSAKRCRGTKCVCRGFVHWEKAKASLCKCGGHWCKRLHWERVQRCCCFCWLRF